MANLQTRLSLQPFSARAEPSGELILEGYFSVFDKPYELWDGAREVVVPGAFANTLGKRDVRALINHDSTFVLGRQKNGTLTLTEDVKGLHGTIRLNPDDSAAKDAYARVKRGDVDQCSFGFNIVREEMVKEPDGSHTFRIHEVDLHEVSIVTFPAYEQTSVSARKADFERMQREDLERRKKAAIDRLKGA